MTSATGHTRAADLPTPEEALAILGDLARPFVQAADSPEIPASPASTELARGDIGRYRNLKALFGALPDALPDPLIVVNPQGLIVLANIRTTEMFGYEEKELLGAPIELLIPVRFRREHVKHRTEFFQVPRNRPMGASLNLCGLRKGGGEFPVEVSLNPLPTAEGMVVVSTVRDISERVRLEKRYRTLIEGIPAVTFMAALDAGLSELYVSPQIEKLLGFSQQEWLEDPLLWYRQLHSEDKARWHGEFARTCATGDVFRSEYRFMSRDGRVVWVLGEAKVVRGEDGRPLFMQGIAFDITPMKLAEQQLKAHKQDLERLVQERTAELEEKARKLEKYGSFVAHELRKPLNRMVDESRERQEQSRGKRQTAVDELAVWVADKTQDMLVMIDRMLKWARIADRSEKRLVPNDCMAAFTAACKKLTATITETGAVITCGPLPTVLAAQPDDRDDWPEVVLLFENLINNALKYRSLDRSPGVQVEAKRRGDDWLFSCADNGIGIEPQYYERIFELFKRLHPQHRIPGHGIGLAYCQGVVKSLGGRMWVDSEYGKGSTFFFTLPVAADYPGLPTLATPVSVGPGSAAPGAPKARRKPNPKGRAKANVGKDRTAKKSKAAKTPTAPQSRKTQTSRGRKRRAT